MILIKHFDGHSFLNSKDLFWERSLVFAVEDDSQGFEKKSETNNEEYADKTDIFRNKQKFDVLEGLSQTKNSKELTYKEYLDTSLSEISLFSHIYSVDWNEHIPQSLRALLREVVEWKWEDNINQDEKAALKKAKEDPELAKLFDHLKEKNYQDWLEGINKSLKSHVETIVYNLENFTSWIDDIKKEKHADLKSKIWDSKSLDMLSSWYDQESKVFNDKIISLREKFYPEWIKWMYSTPEYYQAYAENVLKELKKNTDLSDEEYDKCFDGWSINSEVASSTIWVYLNPSISRYAGISKYWKYFSSEEEEMLKIRASSDALNKVNEKYFKEFKNEFKKSESILDTVIDQYNEYIELAENPKDKVDCEELIKSLPIDPNSIEKVLESMDKSAYEFIDNLHELNPNIPSEYFEQARERLWWEEIAKLSNDKMFWTVIYDELLKAEKHFYDQLMSEDSEVDQNWMWINWEELNKKSIDDCENIFSELLDWKKAEWEGEEDKKWLFYEVSDLLEQKKDSVEDYDNVNSELYKIRSDLKTGQDLNKQLKKSYESSNSEKEKERFLARIRKNSKYAFDAKTKLEDYKNKLMKFDDTWTPFEIQWYSLMDVYNAYKNIKTFWDERLESRSKWNWHKLARDVTSKIPAFEQLSSAQDAEANRAYAWMVDKWKESFKDFSISDLNERLEKASKKKVDNDELEAVISMLSEKWMLQYNNDNFLKALNRQLYSSEQIDIDSFYKLDQPDKQKLLKQKFKKIFNGSDTIFQEIDDKNTKSFSEKANNKQSEITKMGRNIWKREFEIYKDYMEIAWDHLDENKQLRKWHIVSYDEDTNIDPMLLEEWIFFAIKEAASDPNVMMWYLIRWLSSWLIPLERISQIEERWIYWSFWQLNFFRNLPIEVIKKIDRELTDDWKYAMLDPESSFMRERTNQLMYKIKRFETNRRRNWNQNTDGVISGKVDQDLIMFILDDWNYERIEDKFLDIKSWTTSITDKQWTNAFWSFSTNVYHFWKDINWKQLSYDEILKHEEDTKGEYGQNVDYIDNLINVMQLNIALNASKVRWIYWDKDDKWRIKLSSSVLEQTAGMDFWANIGVKDYSESLIDIMREVLNWDTEWKKIWENIYPIESDVVEKEWKTPKEIEEESERIKGAKIKVTEYFGKWNGDFKRDWEDYFSNNDNKRKLVEVVQKHQREGKVPTYYKWG